MLEEGNNDYDNYAGPDDVSLEEVEQSLINLKDFINQDISNINTFADLVNHTSGVAKSIHTILLANHSKSFTGYGGLIPSEVESELDLDPRAYTLSLDMFIPHANNLETTHVFEGDKDILHLDYVHAFRRKNVLNISVHYNNFPSNIKPTEENMQVEPNNELLEINIPLDGIDPLVLETPNSLFPRDEVEIDHTVFRMKKSKDEFMTQSAYLNYKINASNVDKLRSFAKNLQITANLVLIGEPLRLVL